MDQLERALTQAGGRSGTGRRGASNADSLGFPSGIRGIEGEQADNIAEAMAVMKEFMEMSPEEIVPDDISQLQNNLTYVWKFLNGPDSERDVEEKERLGADKALEASETVDEADEFLDEARESVKKDRGLSAALSRVQRRRMAE